MQYRGIRLESNQNNGDSFQKKGGHVFGLESHCTKKYVVSGSGSKQVVSSWVSSKVKKEM